MEIVNESSGNWIIILVFQIFVLLLAFIYRRKIIAFFKGKNIWGIIFNISFIIYIYIIFRSLVMAIRGFKFLAESTPVYGFRAFIECFIFYVYFFTFFIPIIPIVVLYQIIYVIVRKKKK